MNIIILCVLFFFALFSTAKGEEIAIYVAPSGNDSWSGKTIDKPFATLQKARDAVRALKKTGKLNQPVSIYLRGGTYELSSPLILTTEDSGTESCPVTYKAYSGEKPVISGGKEIRGTWKIYRDKIKVCSLDEVKAGKWMFRQLFVNGKRQIRAHSPNEGFLKIDKSDEDLGKAAFKYREGDLKKWDNLNTVEVVFFHAWNESRLLISNLDEKSKVVSFTGPIGGQPLGRGINLNRYYVENSLKFLDQPGEWYLDKISGKLYYWLPDSVKNAEMRAPVLKELLRLEGSIKEKKYVQYVNIEGLIFSETDWTLPKEGYPSCGDVGDIALPSAITLNEASHCILKNNVIRNTGGYAIEVTGSANQITGNEIYDTGGGGIISRNYDKEPNAISYNHIHHCGEIYPSAVGINIDDGGGVVSHNLIHDISQSGIYARHWATDTQAIERRNQEQGLLIENNEIYNVMQKLNDGAGIFVRDSSIVIKNNLIHDVNSYGTGTPGWGIYLGCETRDTKVINNLVYRTREGLHVWFSNRNNTIENNIFVDGEICLVRSNNTKDRHHENIRFIKNIFSYTKTDADIFKIDGEGAAPVESDNNIFWNSRGCVWLRPVIWGLPGVDYFADWQKRGFDSHSIVADPQFVDRGKDDYSLKSGSPAFKVGFKAIDFSTVGIRGKAAKE